MPGCVIAAARHDRPTIIVYGGTIQPGVRKVDCPALGYKKGDDMTAVDAFESYGKNHGFGSLLLCINRGDFRRVYCR